MKSSCLKSVHINDRWWQCVLQLAQLLDRDKNNCQAIVQLLSDRDTAIALPFDAICEYAADVSMDSFDY